MNLETTTGVPGLHIFVEATQERIQDSNLSTIDA